MVLLISKPLEPSTDKVIDWLYYTHSLFCRINGADILDNASLEIGNEEISFQLHQTGSISPAQIKSVWYRRDGDKYIAEKDLADINQEPFHQTIIRSLNNELKAAKKGLFGSLALTTRILGSFSGSSPNKIEVLGKAKKNGLDIPATLMTTSKNDLIKFIEKHDTVITKAIWESATFSVTEKEITSYTQFTEEIFPETLKTIPDNFFYSLFQEKLDKSIEIRTFYLDGDCYSMAIFSQMDIRTSTDFRKYTNNRNVPFKLPAEIEKKIDALMHDLSLNTGSIDIVKTKCGRYVFIEVNPVGQYDMVTVPCNYHLDKKIAEFLTAN